MIDLLMSETAFERLETALSARKSHIRPRLVYAKGTDRPWGEPDAGARTAIFASADAMYGKDPEVFIEAALAIEPLDWFQSPAAGVEKPIFIEFGRKARLFTRARGQSIAMAEYALWQALDFLRTGPAHRANRADKIWKRVGARELGGSHWMIFGFGGIARETARRVRALGGRVTGVRRTPGPDDDADAIITPAEAPSHLGEADIVMLCPPHTPETEDMADESFFAAMKPDALFMNVGRGALVVEDDLMAALDAGRPAYAVLDVTREEPLPPDSPLWDHAKIEMTPHDSPMTRATFARNDDDFLDNLDAYIEGRPLAHLVDKSEFA